MVGQEFRVYSLAELIEFCSDVWNIRSLMASSNKAIVYLLSQTCDTLSPRVRYGVLIMVASVVEGSLEAMICELVHS
ncbi:hypothetical protein WICPIJ_007126 [Wickerhamomyces pijperi]|uniref:Uncharacterized protein n=1 Tax=Wickerhamomyces pijperi TaxID=599730 RepID=A0A9P8TKR0_WICPI|nr:hypothetical protein WICPIJ_007126 [Wickerhamomyces pijperi]